MRLNYIISYHSYEFDAVSVKLTEYLQVTKSHRRMMSLSIIKSSKKLISKDKNKNQLWQPIVATMQQCFALQYIRPCICLMSKKAGKGAHNEFRQKD